MNQPAENPAPKALALVIKSAPFQADLKAQLPPGVPVDRFTATVLAALRHNPDLLEVDRNSFYNAVLKAAAEGLLPDGTEGVINIYNVKVARNPDRWEKRAQWQRMVGGIIKQYAKAGINAYAVSVYERDNVRAWFDGNGQHIEISPMLFGERGPRIGAVAVAKMPDGTIRFEAMNLDDLKKVREASKSKDSGPWVSWPDRMEQKAALHRLRKRVAILDPDAEELLKKLDDEFEDDAPAGQRVPDVSTGNGQRPVALQKALDAPSQAGVELPAATMSRQSEPELVEREPGSDDDMAPRAGDIF